MLQNILLDIGGKQWQTTPKNLPRMQRTRAIPVDWLSSGLCPNRPKGWIPIINNNNWRQKWTIQIFQSLTFFPMQEWPFWCMKWECAFETKTLLKKSALEPNLINFQFNLSLETFEVPNKSYSLPRTNSVKKVECT